MCIPRTLPCSEAGRQWKWSDKKREKDTERWRRGGISIPVLSRRYDRFIHAIEIAPVCPTDPTPSSRSDLRYVPTQRTFLLYKCFLFGGSDRSGSRGSGLTCRKKRQIPGIFSAISRDFPLQFRGFSSAISGIFTAISGISPRIFRNVSRQFPGIFLRNFGIFPGDFAGRK